MNLHLIFEEGPLENGVVELGVGINNFMIINEEFEPFAQLRIMPVILGERGHDLRMVDDEGGTETVDFEEMSSELIEQPGSGARRRTFATMLFGQRVQLLLEFQRAQVLHELHLHRLLQSADHADLPERRLEVYHPTLPSAPVLLDRVDRKQVTVVVHLQNHRRQHILRYLHRVMVISIGHVKLASREFRVVCLINTLVSEILAYI